MNKLLSIILTLFVASNVWAQPYDFEKDGICYSVKENSTNNEVLVCSPKYTIHIDDSGDGCGVSSYSSTVDDYSGNVTIPSSVIYDGKIYNVTSIKDGAFYNCEALISITIPNTISLIGDGAFYRCENLTSVTIPESVTSIGKWAFKDCKKLTTITIPNSVTSIGTGAFEECENLTSVTIPESVTSIGKRAFKDCKKLTTITIPNSVTSIGKWAFEECEKLTTVTIPNSVTSIGDGAFYSCKNLTSVTIPNSVTSIGEMAFYSCEKLTSIAIPKSVTSIGRDAFGGRSNFTSITIDSYADLSEAGLEFTKNGIKYNILSKYLVEIAENWDYTDETEDAGFSFYSGDIVIPESVEMTNNTYVVTGIGKDAFYGGHDITSITIPNSVTTIEEDAFEDCTGLTSITLPSSVTSIKAGAFEECTNLTSVICLAEIPPIVISDKEGYNCDPRDSHYEECREYAHVNPFETGGRNAVTVYVPSDVVSLYRVALDWRSSPVDIQPIPAENVTISKDEVDVKVEKATADFYMPINASADSYTLTIKNNGVTFCTLTFNAQGQLANIDFSTTKSYELKADVSAFKFTVTGLSEATNYGYSFKALASNKSVLKEYTGSFTTKNADGTGGSSSGGEGTLAIDNVSANNAVTIANNQILVNGEAPAFVVTISGKKITNQNLKSGVYFVNVEGETVKVVLK